MSLRKSASRQRLFAAVAGALVVLLGGCGEEIERGAPLHGASEAAFRQEAFQKAAGTREAALQALDAMKRGAMQGAFANLQHLAYTRHVRTEQLGAGGQVKAFEERVARHTPGGGLRIVRSDSSGTFDLGLLGRFTSTEADAPATNLARQVLPEEPAFLSERSRYAFRYRLLPDTALAGGPAHVVAVRARPGPDGDKQTVRRARLYLNKDTGQLVAVRLHRVRRSLLFDEDTRQYVRIRPVPHRAAPDSTGWVPAETRFQTRLHMPLRPARRFRSSASYDQYRPAS